MVEHALENHHPIHLEETAVLNHGREQNLLVNEALYTQMTPLKEHFNQDSDANSHAFGVRLMHTLSIYSHSNAWKPKSHTHIKVILNARPHHVSSVVHGYKQQCFVMDSQLFTFALMTTGAFTRNIGKVFSKLKLVTNNPGKTAVHHTL